MFRGQLCDCGTLVEGQSQLCVFFGRPCNARSGRLACPPDSSCLGDAYPRPASRRLPPRRVSHLVVARHARGGRPRRSRDRIRRPTYRECRGRRCAPFSSPFGFDPSPSMKRRAIRSCVDALAQLRGHGRAGSGRGIFASAATMSPSPMASEGATRARCRSRSRLRSWCVRTLIVRSPLRGIS